MSLLQAERVNRTWKSKLMYDLEHHREEVWVTQLPKYAAEYNESAHRSLGEYFESSTDHSITYCAMKCEIL